MTQNGSTSLRRMAVIAYHSSPLQEPGVGDAGGMTVYVRALAAALARMDLATDIFTRAAGDSPRIADIGPSTRVISVPAGPLARIPKEQGPDHLDEFANGVRAFATAQRARYELIHSHYWQSGLAGLALSEAWGVPLVHSNHSLGKVKNRWLAPGDRPEPPRRLAGEERVIADADVLVASTENEWQQLSCLYGAPHDRVKILYPGVDHMIFSPGDRSAARAKLGLPPDALVLMYAGRIQRLKGLELAIQSLVHVRRSVQRPVLLAVVGGSSGANNGDDEETRLRELARRSGVADAVRFMGPQPHASLAEYYRASDVVVVCSYSESFGLTALEAHACGIPVVGTPVGGLSHIVWEGQSGWLVEERDSQVFADRLADLSIDESKRGAFGRCAFERSMMFSWDNTANEFVELYECLVRERFPEVCTC
jgi:D-inositol-3-phosphate glycosyltransferase